MKRTLVLLLVAMTTSLQGFAIVRSQQVMKEIANRQLQQMGINGMVTLATETNTYAIYRSAMQRRQSGVRLFKNQFRCQTSALRIEMVVESYRQGIATATLFCR